MTAQPQHPKKWLVVKLADIGDLLLITPALARLRGAQPESEIHVLTTAHSAPVLPPNLVDKVILFDKFAFDNILSALQPDNLKEALNLAKTLRQERYDGVIILHHLTTRFGALKYAALALATGASRRVGLDNGRGGFLTNRVVDEGFGVWHEAACWLQVIDAAIGHTTVEPYTPTANPLQIRQGEEDQKWATHHLPPDHDRPRIVIHPGSGGYSLARRWTPERFAATADALHNKLGAQIIIVGGQQDNTVKTIAAMNHLPTDLTGRTTLGQLQAILASSDLFIGADSGVMHLAAASGTPAVAIFGPSNASAWGPWTENALIVRSAPRCSPCSYIRHTVGLREGCAARTCMQMVTPEQVLDAATQMLTGQAPATSYPYRPVPKDERVRLLGIPLDAITWQDLREKIKEWIAGNQPRQICTVNPEFVMVAQQDPHFYALLNRVDLCAADGQGLLWAAKHVGKPLPDRITGSDGLPLIAQWAAEEGWKLFLLGAAEGVADRAAAILQQRYEGLQITGTHAGSPAPAEEDEIVAKINQSGADILFVAYGAPRQDKWIARNLPRLNVKVAMGVGASIDFVAGVQVRAPKSWQRFGLEWLYRLIREPWRWKRMTRLPRFVIAVLLRGQKGPARFEGLR